MGHFHAKTVINLVQKLNFIILIFSSLLDISLDFDALRWYITLQLNIISVKL